MPLPKPRQGENRAEFISRCMSNENVQNEAADRDQALAICHSIWEERAMNPHEKLLTAIKDRDQKLTEFGYGILTADKYVRTMQEFVGDELCYRMASDRRLNQSFNDVLVKAGQTLVYGNPDMVVEEKQVAVSDDIELPKNTLMVFKHVLTTPRKDRDGDILRTEGAAVDPALPLLWQHVHTLPIGKMLAIAEHTSSKLSLITAIVDINELAHDAAVMVDNGMGRFSHGFRALEFEELKEQEGETTGGFGFDIKRFEIMEESIVSVPSNVDAEEEEVMLSLVEGGKLTSGVMKEYSKRIRSRLPITVAVDGAGWVVTTTEDMIDEDEPGSGGDETKGTGQTEGESGAPEEADVDQEKETATAGDTEVKIEDDVEEKLEEPVEAPEDEKAGRALSKRNLAVLKDVRGDLQEMMDKESLSRGGQAMCERCINKLGTVISSVGSDEDEEDKTAVLEEKEISVRDAVAAFVARASEQERITMLQYLQILGRSQEAERRTRAFRAMVG